MLDKDHIANYKGVLLGLHPDILTQLAVPDEGGVLKDGFVYIFVLEKVFDLGMLLASVKVLFDVDPPFMDLFDEVDGYLPQPGHVCKDA